jgi:hypothetical protein
VLGAGDKNRLGRGAFGFQGTSRVLYEAGACV